MKSPWDESRSVKENSKSFRYKTWEGASYYQRKIVLRYRKV